MTICFFVVEVKVEHYLIEDYEGDSCIRMPHLIGHKVQIQRLLLCVKLVIVGRIVLQLLLLHVFAFCMGVLVLVFVTGVGVGVAVAVVVILMAMMAVELSIMHNVSIVVVVVVAVAYRLFALLFGLDLLPYFLPLLYHAFLFP